MSSEEVRQEFGGVPMLDTVPKHVNLSRYTNESSAKKS